MKQKTLESQLCRQLANLTATNPDDWFLVYKARLGLELTFQTLAEQRGRGEIITQPFTCITAVNPIIAAGHIPVYADTDPATFSLQTNELQISASAKAIVVQHTFGIEANATTARDFADQHHLLLVEDSAHRLGQMAKHDERFLADVSVHSFGVEKMLPTKFGGAVWINPELADEDLHAALVKAFRDLPIVDRATNRRARHYAPTNRLLNHMPGTIDVSLRDTLARFKLFEAAISPKELSGANSGPVAKPRSWMIKSMLDALEGYEALLQKRTTVTDFYRISFLNHKKFTLPSGCQGGGALVRLPLLCDSAQTAATLFNALRQKGFYIGKWYRPTLFPGPSDPNIYNYDRELCPTAEDLSSRIINLPTNITLERAKELVNELNR